jgi:hypothetical protein
VAIVHLGGPDMAATRATIVCMPSFLLRAARLAGAAALAGAALAPAAHAAPTVLSAERAATPVAAWNGTVAWSHFDAAAGGYELVVSRGGAAPQPLAVTPSPVPFDVDLGTNRNGSAYAVYTRCTTPATTPAGAPARGTGCDVYRTSLATGVEQRLASLSSPSWDERDPTIFRGEIAFIRTETHGGVTSDVLRIANTTSGARATRALVKVPASSGGLAAPELSFDRIAYVRTGRGRIRFGERVVHVRSLLTRGRDRAVYTATSGGANAAGVTGISLTEDLRAFTWARTNNGSGAGNRLVRYTVGTGRLEYALGSSRYVSTAWAGAALGMAVTVDDSGTGTCFANVADPPERTLCRVELTGPVSWNARP